MADYQRIDWPFPVFGLMTEIDPDYLPPQALAAVNNMYYIGPELLRSRGGFRERFAPGGGKPIEVMYQWDYDDKLYIADDNSKLWKDTTAIAGVVNNVKDIVSYGTEGTQRLLIAEEELLAGHTLHTYNGAAYAQLVGVDIPNPTRLYTCYGRVFAIGDVSHPSRVFFCEVNNIANWGGDWGEGGWFDVYPDENGDLIDIIFYRNSIYFFKERGTYILSGHQPVSFLLTPFEQTIGTATRTAANAESGVIYCTDYGVYPLGRGRGGETMNLVWRVKQGAATPLASPKAAYALVPGAYMITDGTTKVWVSNIDNRPDVWTTWTAPFAMQSIYQGPKLYLGGVNGKVYSYEPDIVVDGAVPITCSFKTGNYDFGQPVHVKNIRFLHGAINASDNATATVGLYKDGAGAAMETHVLAAGVNPVHTIRDINKNCDRSLAIEVTYSALTGPCYFRNIALDLAVKAPIA